MKKIVLIILMLILACPTVLAQQEEMQEDNIFVDDPETNIELQGYLEFNEADQDAIYLDEMKNASSLNLKAPTKMGAASIIPKQISQDPYIQSMREIGFAASKFSNMEYSIAPVSAALTRQKGGFSVGTMYNSSLDDSSQINFSTGLYTKYDHKRFSLMAAASKQAKSQYDSYSDKIYFAPELKLTKRLSILDIMQATVLSDSKKHEIVLRYTPSIKGFSDDVQFELGAGQSFAADKLINTSIRFSTRFRL